MVIDSCDYIISEKSMYFFHFINVKKADQTFDIVFIDYACRIDY